MKNIKAFIRCTLVLSLLNPAWATAQSVPGSEQRQMAEWEKVQFFDCPASKDELYAGDFSEVLGSYFRYSRKADELAAKKASRSNEDSNLISQLRTTESCVVYFGQRITNKIHLLQQNQDHSTYKTRIQEIGNHLNDPSHEVYAANLLISLHEYWVNQYMSRVVREDTQDSKNSSALMIALLGSASVASYAVPVTRKYALKFISTIKRRWGLNAVKLVGARAAALFGVGSGTAATAQANTTQDQVLEELRMSPLELLDLKGDERLSQASSYNYNEEKEVWSTIGLLAAVGFGTLGGELTRIRIDKSERAKDLARRTGDKTKANIKKAAQTIKERPHLGRFVRHSSAKASHALSPMKNLRRLKVVAGALRVGSRVARTLTIGTGLGLVATVIVTEGALAAVDASLIRWVNWEFHKRTAELKQLIEKAIQEQDHYEVYLLASQLVTHIHQYVGFKHLETTERLLTTEKLIAHYVETPKICRAIGSDLTVLPHQKLKFENANRLVLARLEHLAEKTERDRAELHESIIDVFDFLVELDQGYLQQHIHTIGNLGRTNNLYDNPQALMKMKLAQSDISTDAIIAQYETGDPSAVQLVDGLPCDD